MRTDTETAAILSSLGFDRWPDCRPCMDYAYERLFDYAKRDKTEEQIKERAAHLAYFYTRLRTDSDIAHKCRAYIYEWCGDVELSPEFVTIAVDYIHERIKSWPWAAFNRDIIADACAATVRAMRAADPVEF